MYTLTAASVRALTEAINRIRSNERNLYSLCLSMQEALFGALIVKEGAK
jgi:hypothetical protein